MNKAEKRQQGFGHIGIIAIIVAVAVVGFGGWWVWKHHNKTSVTTAVVQQALKNAKCDYSDKDLCKFFASWKAQPYYTVTSTSDSDGQKTTTIIQIEGSKSHMTISGASSYDVITIGQDTYTKAADGTWWKQTTTNSTAKQLQDTANTTFTDPSTSTDAAAKITYKNLGKEKCGNLTCFKYQEMDPSDAKATTILWFDDQDYQLRRTQTTSDSGTFDATYSYGKISVSVPSPVKDLGANQYLLPSQSQPTTLPGAGDSAQTLQNYQNQLNNQ